MVDGLRIVHDFVTRQEERELIDCIGVSEEVPAGRQRNRILRYGPGVASTKYLGGYAAKAVPELLDSLCERLVAQGLVAREQRPNAVSVNEYHPGQGIGFHVDNDRCGDVISTLALAGAANLLFRDGSGVPVVVPHDPRALIQMTGACRRDPWQHAIAPVNELRYSVVFRYGTPT